MIRRTLFAGAAILLLLGLVVGTGAVSYVSTAWTRVHDRVKSNVPVAFEIDRARTMVKELVPEIEQNMLRIAREEVEIAKIDRNLKCQAEQLAKSRREILRLKGDLETGQSHFVYAGRSYTPTQVKTDLSNRFEHFKTCEATVDQLGKILRARENGLNAAREKLEGMLAAKRQLEVEIENLEARLKMVQVAQTTSEFNFDDSQLSQTRELINEIATRLDVSEKMVSQTVQLADRIPLDEPAADKGHIVDTVTQYFDEHPSAETLAGTDVQ